MRSVLVIGTVRVRQQFIPALTKNPASSLTWWLSYNGSPI